MYVVRGRLTPEVGALLMRALEAASASLYRDERALASKVAAGSGKNGAETGEARDLSETAADRDVEAARRRADAIGLLAERALAAGFTRDAPITGKRAERYQVMLHVELETLASDQEPGRSELEDGTRVSAETSRRLACDAAVVRVTRSKTGEVLNVGRKTRTIPPPLRRALEVRDRGCRFPGCGLRFTDAHHVVHWADGGETSLDNCVLLCGFHHRLVHEGGWRIQLWKPGEPVFIDPRGKPHGTGEWRPPRRLPEKSVEALLEENRRRGIDPDEWSASASRNHGSDVALRVPI